MYVRCTHCGYDNSPEYRFCGMCGASLAHPPAPEAQPPVREIAPAGNGNAEAPPVHGPSFLGLADDPKVEFHYLYEDEPPRSHVGMIVLLLVIAAAGGFIGWQWHHGGFPFNSQAADSSSSSQSAPSSGTTAPNQTRETQPDNQGSGAAAVNPTAPEKTQPDATGNASSGNASEGHQNPGTSPTESSTPAEKVAPEKVDEAEAAPPPSVPARSRVTKASKRPSSRASTRTAVSKAVAPQAAPPAASPDADLELAGERYLYGNGIPRNCARAESSLRTAALHGNSKAQTVLGTMYATGHCVSRDLPIAYRWFARALHKDPQNSRISADLQVLWRQMSPQEKQLATTNNPQGN
jgi:hypothetical protein